LDVLFLDANVLFSAAYKPGAGMLRFWELEGVELVSSGYAVEEARSNLGDAGQRERLASLVGRIRIVEEAGDIPLPPDAHQLPEKDRPILAAALLSGATHLITGDISHFGRYFGKEILGVLVIRPAEYLHLR
jgi:predicted nucleic acid-binding protein